MAGEETSCVLGARNEQRIQAIEKSLVNINTVITEIRDKLLGRPSWVILFMFTGMSSSLVAVTSALIYIVSSK